MTELIIIEQSDIMAFVEENTKANNDSTNKKRELIIENILDITEDYLNDEIYGKYWTKIQKSLLDSLDSICDIEYNNIIIEQKGGMKYNYDFIVKYCDKTNNIIKTIKLEFKHNNSNVRDLVQFLELYDKDCKSKYELFDYSYSEYYYDNYLDKYLEIDKNTEIVKPTKDIYLKYIHDIKYKQPFFDQIYTNKTTNKKLKDKLVEESRRDFIQTYAETFNFSKLTEKIIESQQDKIFLLWDKNKFHIEKIDVNNITILGVKPGTINSLYFDVVVENFIYDIRVRLNWGNNNGIANPRWKFSFIDK